MIKKLLLSAIIIALTFKGHTQGSSDSVTCIPNSQLRGALVAVVQGQRAQEKLSVCDTTVSLLQRRLEAKDSAISIYRQITDRNNLIKQVDDREIFNLKSQNSLLMIAETKMLRRVKAQKRKTIFIVAGIALAAIANSLFLHL